MRTGTLAPDYNPDTELEAEASRLIETETDSHGFRPRIRARISDRRSFVQIAGYRGHTKSAGLGGSDANVGVGGQGDWLFRTTHALRPIIERDDQPKERYRTAAEAADELLAMKPESTPSKSFRSTTLCAIGPQRIITLADMRNPLD